MRLLSLAYASLLLAFKAQAILEYVTSPNGFDDPPRGWNSWALQADDKLLKLSEASVLEQCKAMASNLNTENLVNKFTYCSIDSGWSPDHGDEYGRIINDDTKFPNMANLASTLHGMGLQLGIYIKPGFFQSDINKTILGTDNIKFSSIVNDKEKYTFENRYQMDYSAPGTQEYCNSNIDQFAQWGVDYIKLDHVTPGTKGAGLPHNNSGIAICYHKAIERSFKNTGHKIRLGLSPKLDLGSDYYKIWSTSADSMRLAGDINNIPTSPKDIALVKWPKVQRAMAYLRAFLRSRHADEKLPIRPDLDPLLIANGGDLNNLTDYQRLTTLAHWVASGANIFLGSDMTKLDPFGLKWLTDPQVWAVADFSARHPIRPVGVYEEKAPSHGIKGEQFQVYVAGPDDKGECVLMVTNYGDSGDNAYYIKQYSGVIKYEITASMLKSFGLDSDCYSIVNVLGAGSDAPQLATSINVALGDSETALFQMTPGGPQCQSPVGEL